MVCFFAVLVLHPGFPWMVVLQNNSDSSILCFCKPKYERCLSDSRIPYQKSYCEKDHQWNTNQNTVHKVDMMTLLHG
jgi:hypothetical protein